MTDAHNSVKSEVLLHRKLATAPAATDVPGLYGVP
jgi:hypothetical protein